MSSITRKPTQTHPADFGKSQDDDETRKLAAKLREVAKKPTEKHALPMTEAQRVGWLHDMASKGMRADMNQRMFKGRGRYSLNKLLPSFTLQYSPFSRSFKLRRHQICRHVLHHGRLQPVCRQVDALMLTDLEKRRQWLYPAYKKGYAQNILKPSFLRHLHHRRDPNTLTPCACPSRLLVLEHSSRRKKRRRQPESCLPTRPMAGEEL